MNKTFSLLFFVKRSKAIANRTAPIYLRITIDGRITEIAAKRYILPDKWNSEAQKVDGSTEEIKSINAYLKTLEQQVYETHHQLMKDKATVSVETLKQRLIGSEERARMLVPIFEDHNKKIEALLGQEFAPGTLERYKTSLKHTIDFLKWKYNVSDGLNCYANK
jgi:hypothetical protein